MSLAKSIGKNIGTNMGKNLSSKYSQNIFYHTKYSATDALKSTSKRAIQKTPEATGDLIGNENADKIIRLPKTSPKNNSKTNEQEILGEKYISPQLRKKLLMI